MLRQLGPRYQDLQSFFDDVQPADYFHGERNFFGDVVHPELLKPGTQGTVREDDILLPENRLPFLNHYWAAWSASHRPWWGARHTVEYAVPVFNEAVTHFADGQEEDAFFDFGRCLHLLQDNASVPHIYADSHPSLLSWVNYADSSGYEKWCAANRDVLHSSDTIEPVASLAEAMERLGTEAFVATRIPGALRRDHDDPVGGDLAELFPATEYVAYVPLDPLRGFAEYWTIAGVGENYHGDVPARPDLQWFHSLPGPVPMVLFWNNTWERIHNPPGEDGEYYYLEDNQDTVIPAKVWSLADGAFVPNTNRYPLAQLWAGVEGFRATRAQDIELIPRAVEYTAGMIRHIWDFINPPPHLVSVRIEQAGETVYEKAWVDNFLDASGPRTTRQLLGHMTPLGRAPVRITLQFSEPVREVAVALGRDGPTLTVTQGISSVPGPPGPEFTDGIPTVVLKDVDISPLPEGPITVFVEARDFSNHSGGDASLLDPDPSTRAGRLPDGSWRGYLGEGGGMPHTDRSHTFRIGGLLVRALPGGRACAQGGTVSHDIQVRNLTLPGGSEAQLAVSGESPGWTTNAGQLTGVRFPLPDSGTGWTTVAAPLEVTNAAGIARSVTIAVSVTAGAEEATTLLQDWATTTPNPDHPDDTASVADPRYPTPWLLDPDAPIGILAGGWGAGLGHLLGRYGIATALVDERLEVLNHAGRDLRDLRTLLIGSGGLSGLERSPTLRARLDGFVAGGGVLVVFTPQRGAELAALPGGQVAGFGWSEDQACFAEAVSIAARHPALSGQDRLRLDAGADGYLTRWPEDAQVLLRRTGTSQPAMIRYPHGKGEVVVLTLYPDWAYGAGQSTPAERALVRDLVTWALARPEAVPAYLPGDPVSLQVPAYNASDVASSAAELSLRTPDREIFATIPQPSALAPGESALLPLSLAAPATLGIHPLDWTLLDGAGSALHGQRDAAFFAVRAPLAIEEITPAEVRMWVTVASDTVPVGGSAVGTVHLLNPTDREFAGSVAVAWTHRGVRPMVTVPGVRIPPLGETTLAVAYSVPVAYPFTLEYGLYEGDPPASDAQFYSGIRAHAAKGFHVFTPRLTLALRADDPTLLPGRDIAARLEVFNPAPAAFPVELTLRLRSPSNQDIWSQSTPLDLPAGASAAADFTLRTDLQEPGSYAVEAEARQGGALLGQAVLFLQQPRPSVALVAHLPAPWRMGAAQEIRVRLLNSGLLPAAAGTVNVALRSPGGTALWTGQSPSPPLAPGESAEVAVPSTLPTLPFGDLTLEVVLDFPGGAARIAQALDHRPVLEVSPSERILSAGDLLEGTVTVFSPGVLAGDAVLSLGIPRLGFAQQVAVDTAQPLTHIPFAVAIPDDVAPGACSLSAELRLLDTVEATEAVYLPPARLDFLPLPAEADAGATLSLTGVNTGGTLGLLDIRVRLLDTAADPDDPQTASHAEVTASRNLAPGEDAAFDLPLPGELASGLYAVHVTAEDRASGLTHVHRVYLFVRGATASLSVVTDQAAYTRGEPVTARAAVANGPQPLGGATLRLSVTGSGGIDPVPFEGTVYVSPAGDDATGNGTPGRPFATPQAAIDAAPAGARVLLLAGDYAGPVLLREGTILQGEVIAGEPVAVLADGEIASVSGVVLDHLRLRNAHVVFTGDARRVRITDCVFEDTFTSSSAPGQGVVFAAAASDVLIGRNRFARFSGDRAGVQVRGDATRVLLLENSFSDFQVQGTSGVHFWRGARDVLVQGNRFTALAGACNGIHFWYASGGTLAGLRLLNNRIAQMDGDCHGIHLWQEADGVEIRGNELADLDRDCNGIHLWYRTLNVAVADNLVRRLRGDAGGVHLWGYGEPNLHAAVEGNLLEDLGPWDGASRNNGLHVWWDTSRLLVSRNVLRRIRGAVPADLTAGIALHASGTAVEISRNVVAESDGGILLRPPPSGARRAAYLLEAVVANNLLAGNVAGIVEETVNGGGASELRDNLVLGCSRAGILYANSAGIPAASPCRHNDLHGNAAAFEGRPDLTGVAGNLAADPLLVDPAAGDYRLSPGSPCHDAGSLPSLDIGPLDDDAAVALGPRPVAPAALAVVHWQEDVPLDLSAGGVEERSVAVAPLAAAGRLFLRGRLATPGGQLLAEAAAAFTVQTESVLLSLSTPRAAYRPGEPIPVALTVLNTAGAAVDNLLIRLTRDGSEILSQTLSLGPGGTASLACETTADRDTVLHAAAGLASADLPVAVATPELSLQVLAPAAVGDDEFPLTALLANHGRVPADLQVDLAGEPHSLTLQPGDEKALTRACRIDADTTFLVLVTGDLLDAATRLVRYGVLPEVRLEAFPLYPAGEVAVPVVLANRGSVGASVVATVRLESGGRAAGEWPVRAWLGAGEESRTVIALGALAPGSYRLQAASGAATAEAAFQVANPAAVRLTLLEAAAALDGAGSLPLRVRVRNEGGAPFSGILRVESSFASLQQDLFLGLAAEAEETFALPVSSLVPGSYAVSATVSVNGIMFDRRETTVDLRPELAFSDPPRDFDLMTGETASVSIGLRNAGLARALFSLRLAGADLVDQTLTGRLQPGAETAVEFVFDVPADFPEDLPRAATLTLTDLETGASAEHRLLFWLNSWFSLIRESRFDRPVYRDGETARLTLTLANRMATAAPLRAVVSHGGSREWRDFVIGPPGQLDGLDFWWTPGELRLDYGRTTGTLTSAVLDAGGTAGAVPMWDADVPPGCALAVETRTGDTPLPDAGWSPWDAASPGAPIPDRAHRFLQYRLTLASPYAGLTPILRELRVELPTSGRRIVHTTAQDFVNTPLPLEFTFPVEFSSGDQVFFGVYHPSGRSVFLDAATLRRADDELSLWTDQPRYYQGTIFLLHAEAAAPGVLEVETPWQQATHGFAGPGTAAIPLALPWELRSGSYLIAARFLGQRHEISIEVVGYRVDLLRADLDRDTYLPGEPAVLSLELLAPTDLLDITAEGWLTDGREMRPAFSAPIALNSGLNALSIDFPVGLSRRGPATLEFVFYKAVGADPRGLLLTGGRVAFDVLAPNRAPVAEAGGDLVVEERTWVTLDGSGSSDPDGDALSWSWTQTAGPAADLYGAGSARPVFLAPEVGREGETLELALVVSDGQASSPPDTVRVLVANVNRPPVAGAGVDVTRRVGETAVLDGSGSHDPDGDLLTFHWELTARPEGSLTSLDDLAALAPVLQIDRPGEYEAALTVDDGLAVSAPDTVHVSTVNSRPVALAGDDFTARPGARVSLDGSASDDADGDPLSFAWSFVEVPAGSAAILDDPSLERPSFTVDACGSYIAELRVSDGALESDPDRVTVDCVNSRPVADAGPDRVGRVGQRVTFTGRASRDPDGDPLSFTWAFTARPRGSRATLSAKTTPLPSFRADRPGAYAVSLRVSDGSAQSVPDSALASIGTDLARASVFLKPASLRLTRPPAALQVWIELPRGFSAREINPNRAAITAVGTRTISRPVRRLSTKGARIADRDRDGRPELVVFFPVKPLLRYLAPGRRNRLKFEGPLRTWGRFLGYGTLRAAR